MRRKITVLVTLAVLLGLLVTISCAQTTTSSTPSPKPTPAPATTPATISAHQPQTAEIWGARPGTNSYGPSYALSVLINKYSPWLRMEIMSTEGSIVHVKRMMAEPDKHARAFFTAPEVAIAMAVAGRYQFQTPYNEIRGIASFNYGSNVLGTYNPNIKSKQDLAGKRVMIFPESFSTSDQFKALVNQIWKMGDVIKISHGQSDRIAEAIRDGIVDAGMVDVTGTPGGPFTPGASLTSLLAEKPGLYFVGFPPEDMREMSKLGIRDPVAPVPPKSFGPNQTETIYGISNNIGWFCHKSMSDDVVYEMCRILYEHVGEVGEIFPPAKVLTKDKLGMLTMPEDQFHPGAVKFYKEKGITIGIK